MKIFTKIFKLNNIVEKIASKHPEWYEKNNALVSAEIKNL